MRSVDRQFSDQDAIEAKPRERAYKLGTSEPCLRLMVRPTGTKVWHFIYSWNGKHNIATLGRFPEVNFKQAVIKARFFSKMLNPGRTPKAVKMLMQLMDDLATSAIPARLRKDGKFVLITSREKIGNDVSVVTNLGSLSEEELFDLAQAVETIANVKALRRELAEAGL